MEMNIVQKWKFNYSVLDYLFSINSDIEIENFFLSNLTEDEREEILNISQEDISEMRAELKNKLNELDKFDIGGRK